MYLINIVSTHTDNDGRVSIEEFTQYLTALSLLEERKVLSDTVSPSLQEGTHPNILVDDP